MPQIRSQEGILSAEWLIDNPPGSQCNPYNTVHQEPEMAETYNVAEDWVTIGFFCSSASTGDVTECNYSVDSH